MVRNLLSPSETAMSQLTAAYRGQQLAALRRLHDRWTADLPAIVEVDAERARHHAEALEDLRRIIARLERLSPNIDNRALGTEVP
jgi:hypothetical protein